MNKKSSLPALLLITDSPRTKTSIHKILSTDFEILISNSKALPFFLFFEKRINLIIIDAKTKVTPAIRLCEQLRLIKKFSTIPVLFLMSKKDLTLTEEAIRTGITNFLYRPLKKEQVQSTLLLAKSSIKKAKIMVNKSRKLQKIAAHDPLTNLYNRWALYELATKELAKAQRNKEPLSLLMIDLDHFKKINDQYGHLFGDSILKNFANLLSESLRSYDIAARFGGEEFVVILPNTSPENALLVAEKLRKKTEISPCSKDINIKLTVSIGVASLSKDPATLQELIQRADTSMYESKHAGRNKVSS